MDNVSGEQNKPVKEYSGHFCKPKGTAHAAGSGLYGLGFIGAAIYFIQHAVNFWDGVFGILKALVWPAPLIYKLLEFLKM